MERHKGGKGTERDERDNQESEKERDRETKERGKGEQKAHVNLMRKSTAPYAHNVLVWRFTITYQNPNLNPYGCKPAAMRMARSQYCANNTTQ